MREIIQDERTQGFQAQAQIYMLLNDERASVHHNISENSSASGYGVRTEIECQVPNHFYKIRVKQLNFRGWPAVSIYATDVTNKVRSKLQKIEYREKWQAATQAESYKSTINHELRTPLESIFMLTSSVLDTLEHEQELSPELVSRIKFKLQLAKTTTILSSSFVEDLLNLRLIQTNKLEVHYAAFDAVKAVDFVLNMFSIKAAS